MTSTLSPFVGFAVFALIVTSLWSCGVNAHADGLPMPPPVMVTASVEPTPTFPPDDVMIFTEFIWIPIVAGE